jgi:hypothetical protein
MLKFVGLDPETELNMTGSQENKQALRVFLCHASDDKPVVRMLYRRLKADGFEPWLDEENILAGEDWRTAIQAAVESSDAVVVCLTHHSVTKTGYIQKEIKCALDKADEKPEGVIFIIPARLEKIAVPSRLSEKQWVDLFKEDGYQRLVTALLTLRSQALAARSSSAYIAMLPEEVNLLEVLWEENQHNLTRGFTVSSLSKRLRRSGDHVEKVLEELGPAGRNMINSGETDLKSLLIPKRPERYRLNYYVLQHPPAAKAVCDLIAVSVSPLDRKGYIASLSRSFNVPTAVARRELLERAEISGYIAPSADNWARVAATPRAREHHPFLMRVIKRWKEWETKSADGQRWISLRRPNHKREKDVSAQNEVPPFTERSGSAASIEREILIREIEDFLKARLAGEPNQERDLTIFWCYYRQGMSAKAIAAIPSIGLTAKGVESQLARTILLVRKLISCRPEMKHLLSRDGRDARAARME